MNSTNDKIKGLANEAVGNVKQGIGNATDNDKLKAEGKAQELKGDAQRTTGDGKDAGQACRGQGHRQGVIEFRGAVRPPRYPPDDTKRSPSFVTRPSYLPRTNRRNPSAIHTLLEVVLKGSFGVRNWIIGSVIIKTAVSALPSRRSTMRFEIFNVGFAASAGASLYGIAVAGRFIAFSSLPMIAVEPVAWHP